MNLKKFLILNIFVFMLVSIVLPSRALATDGVWVPVGSAVSAGYAYETSLAFDSNIPYVAYADDNNSNKATVMRFDGTNWLPVGSAVSTGGASSISLVFDSNIPYVAYMDNSNGNKATVMKFDGTNWVPVGSAVSAGSVSYISLAFDSNIPYVAYRDNNNGGKATVKKFDGTNWVLVGSAVSAGYSYYISLAFDSNIPYVAYMDNRITVMKFDGTNWVPVGSAVSAGRVASISLAFDSNIPYVAYQDTNNGGKATVMKFDGTNWVPVGSAVSTGVANYTSLAFDDSNIPYVAYRDEDNGNKATVKKFDGTNWVPVGSTVSAGGAYYISLAFDSNIPYVAYQDVNNGSKATVMKFFTDPVITSYSGNFSEAYSDDGSVTGSKVITLGNDTFVNASGTLTQNTNYTISPIPAGLTPVMTVSGDGTTATLTFTGNAVSSTPDDSVANLTITFLDGAFTNTPLASGVINYTNNEGTITFVSPTEITSFDPITDLSGVIGHTSYINSEAVISHLPSVVTANGNAVSVPVTTWIDTDNYNSNVAGSYTFTAVLGSIPEGYINRGNYTATVEVVITPYNPLDISSCADFKNINNNLAGAYQLTTDLNCIAEGSSIMVGVVDPFTGVFDGGGHTLSIAINSVNDNNVGLFSQATGASISNLTINGSVHGGSSYVGALVGYGYNLNIENVTSNADVSGQDEVGGLIGELDSDGGNSTISNSHSNGNVSGTGSGIGGLVGYADYSLSINNSYAEGNITVTTSDSIYDIGGLVGYANDTLSLINSHYTGDLILTTTGTGDYSSIEYLGGLVGEMSSGGTIDNSYVEGNITATTAGTSSDIDYLGGLVGFINLNTSITKSYYKGDLEITADSSDVYYIGGIIGYVNDDLVVNSVYTKGNIIATSSLSDAYDIGGLFGYLSDYNISILNAFSSMNITGQHEIGGLIGLTDSNSLNISNTYSIGNITGDENVGGLIGQSTGTLSLSNSFSAGLVTALGATNYGAMIGQYPQEGLTLSNNYFDVTGTGQTLCASQDTLGTTGCTGVNVTNITPNYFKNNSTNPPFESWDFSTIWRTKENDYPTLLYFFPIPEVTPDPTCTDGIQNQDETGIDEGGVCTPEPEPNPEPIPVVHHTSSGSSVSVRYNNLLTMGNTSAAQALAQQFPNQITIPPTTIAGCDNRTTGFSTITGQSCLLNTGTPITAISGCDNRTTGFSTTTGQSCLLNTETTTPTVTPANEEPIIYNFGPITLKNGSVGEAVKELQRFLNANLNLGLVVDGKFGPKTKAVVVLFQKANGLVPDGLVGKLTKAKMNEM